MIAANYRKHPEAMALQMVLVFTRLVWALPRPGSRILRAIRATRAAAFKAAGRIRYPEAKKSPQWCRDVGKRARKLGELVKRAQLSLDFLGRSQPTGYAAHVAWCRETFNRCPIKTTI